MNIDILPPQFTDKIADPIIRQRLSGSRLTSRERFAQGDAKLEREIHKLISNELLRRGIFANHSRMDKRTTAACGVPDYLFVIGGYPIAVEVKLPGKDLSDEQKAVMLQMIGNGWAYYVVHSFDEFAWAIAPYLDAKGKQ